MTFSLNHRCNSFLRSRTTAAAAAPNTKTPAVPTAPMSLPVTEPPVDTVVLAPDEPLAGGTGAVPVGAVVGVLVGVADGVVLGVMVGEVVEVPFRLFLRVSVALGAWLFDRPLVGLVELVGLVGPAVGHTVAWPLGRAPRVFVWQFGPEQPGWV